MWILLTDLFCEFTFRLHKLTDPEQAARAFTEYLVDMDAQNVADRDEQGNAHAFLANYYYKKSDLETAYKHAFKCLEFPEVRFWVLFREIYNLYSYDCTWS